MSHLLDDEEINPDEIAFSSEVQQAANQTRVAAWIFFGFLCLLCVVICYVSGYIAYISLFTFARPPIDDWRVSLFLLVLMIAPFAVLATTFYLNRYLVGLSRLFSPSVGGEPNRAFANINEVQPRLWNWGFVLMACIVMVIFILNFVLYENIQRFYSATPQVPTEMPRQIEPVEATPLIDSLDSN